METLCGEHMRRTRPEHNQNHSHSWRQRTERSERNGEVKGEFSCFKFVFFEAIRFGNNKINYWGNPVRANHKKWFSRVKKSTNNSWSYCTTVSVTKIIGACFFFDIQFKLCFYIHLQLVNNSFVTFWRRFTETKLTTLINFSLIYFVCTARSKMASYRLNLQC